MKKIGILAGIFLGLLVCAGCEKAAPENLLVESVERQTIYLRADGSLQSSYVEDFAESYYDINELREYMEEMIDSFNTEGKNRVELTALSEETREGGSRKVYAILTYNNTETYNAFNSEKDNFENYVEMIAVDEAKERYGESLFTNQKLSEKGKTKAGNEIFNPKKQKVAVVKGMVGGQTEIRTPAKILYFSGGKMIDERTVEIEEDTQVVIVYKK